MHPHFTSKEIGAQFSGSNSFHPTIQVRGKKEEKRSENMSVTLRNNYTMLMFKTTGGRPTYSIK
jgi:hypothetical protein